MQPYGYALGDPLRLADPTGLFSEGGPVSSPPSFGVPSFRFPSGNGKGRDKPVNLASNVPPAPAVGFQDAPAEPPLDQPVIFDPTEAAAGVLAGLIIGGPAGGVLLGVAGGLGRGTLRALIKRLSKRAARINNILDPIARKNRTAAVLRAENASGRTVDILAGGKRDLTPGQRAIAGNGEVLARLPGQDAEITALQRADELGLRPTALGTSRDICPSCQAEIERRGGQLVGSKGAVFP